MPIYRFKCAECKEPLAEGVIWNPTLSDKRILSYGDVVAIDEIECKCGSHRFEKDMSEPCARGLEAWTP